jgi:hypothetical protein
MLHVPISQLEKRSMSQCPVTGKKFHVYGSEQKGSMSLIKCCIFQCSTGKTLHVPMSSHSWKNGDVPHCNQESSMILIKSFMYQCPITPAKTPHLSISHHGCKNAVLSFELKGSVSLLKQSMSLYPLATGKTFHVPGKTLHVLTSHHS